MAPAEEVYQRRNNLTEMSMENYRRYNYSEDRKRIYESCNLVLEIGGLRKEEAVKRLKQAIESLRPLN
jgi:hypothetical protein